MFKTRCIWPHSAYFDTPSQETNCIFIHVLPKRALKSMILWKPIPAPAAGRSRGAPRQGGCPGDRRGTACRPPDPGTERGKKGNYISETPTIIAYITFQRLEGSDLILPDVITSRMCEAGQLSSISTPPKICCFRVSDGWTALKKEGVRRREGRRKKGALRHSNFSQRKSIFRSNFFK